MHEAPRGSRRLFGRYELLLEMARGGMATLYLARASGPRRFQKLVAVKRIHDHLAQEARFIKMFMDEAHITARNDHPNVASVFDMGAEGSAYFLVMEYVHGEDLVALLRTASENRGELPWPYAVRIVCDAAAGLHAAHELKNASGEPLNVVHRDVSPQNILITYDGNVKVVDFGIAYAAERLSQTRTGTIKGKAAYMAPEQVQGLPVDRRADVFSLGIVLWEAICLQRLFREDSDAATLRRVEHADVPPPRTIRSDLPDDLQRIVLKALSKAPSDRYQTAIELGSALEQYLVSSDQYVSHNDLALWMQRQFERQKDDKDACIRGALCDASSSACAELTLPPPGKAAQGTSPEHAAVSAGSLSEPARRPSTRRRRWGVFALLVGGFLASGVIALAVFLAEGRRGDSQPTRPSPGETKRSVDRPGMPSDPAGRPRHPGRPDRRTVTLELTIRPAAVKPVVVFRGRSYQGSIFRIVVPATEQQELVEVDAPGYRRKSLIVTPVKDLRTTVTLTAASRQRVPRRRANPAGSKSPRKIVDFIDPTL
jgi:serine/threonine protein kinase